MQFERISSTDSIKDHCIGIYVGRWRIKQLNQEKIDRESNSIQFYCVKIDMLTHNNRFDQEKKIFCSFERKPQSDNSIWEWQQLHALIEYR